MDLGGVRSGRGSGEGGGDLWREVRGLGFGDWILGACMFV